MSIDKKDAPILITLHGGNFTGGSHTWDGKQTACLERLGYTVWQLNFPTDHLDETLDFLEQKCHQIKAEHPSSPCYLLGRSSGGYLAKILHDRNPTFFDRVIYLAPVFDPRERARVNPAMKQGYSDFFRFYTSSQEIPSTAHWNPKKEILLLADNDKNVPLSCFTGIQRQHARSLGIMSHTALVQTCGLSFQQVMKEVCPLSKKK